MNLEEIVEVTPGADAAELARQLLAIAADPGNPYRLEDVKTTTSGPLGLAFQLPEGLYRAWQDSLGVTILHDLEAAAGDGETTTDSPRRRGRRSAVKE